MECGFRLDLETECDIGEEKFEFFSPHVVDSFVVVPYSRTDTTSGEKGISIVIYERGEIIGTDWLP